MYYYRSLFMRIVAGIGHHRKSSRDIHWAAMGYSTMGVLVLLALWDLILMSS